jgi:formylmethanofuran dehydrogenase subunit E
MPTLLDQVLEQSSARHSHLCPRQVLGARMALAALDILDLPRPITKQTGLIIVETDGCFADGIEAASGATVGHRTLRVNDLGKIAATFASVGTGRTIRLSPKSDARVRALLYAPGENRRYFAQLQGYQIMPQRELFRIQDVMLDPPLAALLSKPSARMICWNCGEEIINEREVELDGAILCRTCAHGGYYAPMAQAAEGLHARVSGYPRGIWRARVEGHEQLTPATTAEVR